MRAYKVLRDGRSEFTGWRWPLPEEERPGEWIHGLITKVEHALSWAGAAPAGYFTAMLAGESATGVHSGPDYDAAFIRERARQAQWLRDELALVH